MMRKPRVRVRHSAQQHTDEHLLQLHKVLAEKLLANPALATPLLAKLELRYQTGLIKHWGYIRWYSMLTQLDQPELFRRALLEDSESMRRLRRKTLLTGILTEEERQQLQPD
ncbi:hypothetical protein ACO1PK_01845 [Alishewanella sp. d11]|uniref:hypothetical protein n=1 Tax=Alishewanella sp. d11 TaxID=3414030 RepID=UPI003BF86CF1